MRLLLTIVVGVSLIGTPCLAEEMADLGSEKAKVNYSVGYQIGDDFKRQGVEINPEALLKGIQDALSGKTPLMTAEEQRTTLSISSGKWLRSRSKTTPNRSRSKVSRDPGGMTPIFKWI